MSATSRNRMTSTWRGCNPGPRYIRRMNFFLSRNSSDLREVLFMVKPSCVLKDAPRLRSLALWRALKAMRMSSCRATLNYRCCVKSDVLVRVLSTHVDDLKFGDTPEASAKLIIILTS